MAKMKYCSDCDRIRNPSHTFCIECGEVLPSYTDVCPECKYRITEDDGNDPALYCPKCGADLEIEKDE